MIPLTKQEQRVVLIVFLLLLTGLAVKTYRTRQPPDGGHSAPEASTHANSQF